MDLHWEVLLVHLLNFRWAYPSERNRVPLWLMHELLDRLEQQLDLPPPRHAAAKTADEALLASFGEAVLKTFVAESVKEAMRLENASARSATSAQSWFSITRRLSTPSKVSRWSLPVSGLVTAQ